MKAETVRFPFEASLREIQRNPEPYVSSVFGCLQSEFLVLPKGPGFVEYAAFEQAYETLKRATDAFRDVSSEKVLGVVSAMPMAIIVLRALLGFTPPEWAHVASERTGVKVDQGVARSIDRKVRMEPQRPIKLTDATGVRFRALVETACILLNEGAPEVGIDRIHRLDKADTRDGVDGIRRLSEMGVPYAMVLYERFLGRPFAGHRDSVSDLIGDGLELAVEEVLHRAGISFRKTKRAERIEGFDQAPDFIVPSEFNPQVIIEAKIAEDDGTARDKVTRIQHLGELSMAGGRKGHPRYEVVACIGGRGFGVRREDMKKMILATRGKVFTLKTLDRLVECSRLREFAVKSRP